MKKEFKCHHCQDSGWLWYTELKNYDYDTYVRNMPDDTQYSCDWCRDDEDEIPSKESMTVIAHSSDSSNITKLLRATEYDGYKLFRFRGCNYCGSSEHDEEKESCPQRIMDAVFWEENGAAIYTKWTTEGTNNKNGREI